MAGCHFKQDVETVAQPPTEHGRQDARTEAGGWGFDMKTILIITAVITVIVGSLLCVLAWIQGRH